MVGLVVTAIGVDVQRVRRIPRDGVDDVGPGPVPGHVLAEVDVNVLLRPLVVGDRDPLVGRPRGRGVGEGGEEGDRGGERGADAHETMYQPFIPPLMWDHTWQW